MKFTRLLSILSVIVLSSPALAAESTNNAVQSTVPTDAATSKATYDQMCAGCHGFRGDGGEGHRGGFSPHIGTLALKEYMSEVPDDYLVMIIKKGGAYMGKMATMPAWEKRLSDADVLGLVAHIRTFTQGAGSGAH